MKFVFLALMTLFGCGSLEPLVGKLPSDTPTRPIMNSNESQCSSVVVSESVALTAAHCVPEGVGAVVLLPEGPTPAADTARHDTQDVGLLLFNIPLPPPYATLGPLPDPGQVLYVEGYGCDRLSPVMPKFSRRPVEFLGIDAASQTLVFQGAACEGDSGGGVYNAAGELVGISSAVAKLADGTPLLFAEPVQFLTPAAQ